MSYYVTVVPNMESDALCKHMKRIASKTTEESRHNAAIALQNRLYVSGWCLSGDLVLLRDGLKSGTVVLKYDGDKPIGVGMISERFVEVFVRKSYRRRGIGRELVNELEKVSGIEKINMSNGIGIDGSDRFFNRVLEKPTWVIEQ